MTELEIVAKLRETAAEREKATADQENKALFVVARLAREDADLMRLAATAIATLLHENELLGKEIVELRHDLDRTFADLCREVNAP